MSEKGKKVNSIHMELLRHGISSYELARMIKMNHKSVYDIIYKGAVPRTGTLQKICNILGLDPVDMWKKYHDDFNPPDKPEPSKK